MAEMLQTVLRIQLLVYIFLVGVLVGDVFQLPRNVINSQKNIISSIIILSFTNPQIITYEKFKKNCKIRT
ncbi:hypothetical protein SAMN05444407_103156 [Chryseobacterium contaminans]|uniref:Uncharacterized protein n=1 Tax=Chryseobacterium contaminans TaxID=1423959 RepID=A0A1M6ZAY5_9FLAO|nr:hypothetical protein SAMN05444407_103156 [Chryseobacterium contaminans]